MKLPGAEAGEGILLRPATPEASGFDALASDAAAEGRRFVARLAGEWRSGANPFDGPGEAPLGAFRGGALVAVGGLNADPCLPGGSGTARLRHVYVRPVRRRAGIGAALTRHLLFMALRRFRRVRPRTGDAGAARLREGCGFGRAAEHDATHALALPG